MYGVVGVLIVIWYGRYRNYRMTWQIVLFYFYNIPSWMTLGKF